MGSEGGLPLTRWGVSSLREREDCGVEGVGGGNDTRWQKESLGRALTDRNASEWSPAINNRRARASVQAEHCTSVGEIQEGGRGGQVVDSGDNGEAVQLEGLK